MLTEHFKRYKPKMKYWFVFLLWSLVMVIGGCYTITKHPDVDQESYLSSKISHREVCSNCHSGFGKFTYENPYRLRRPFESPKLSNWNDYYHYPWWADAFYYPADRSNNPSETLPIDPRSFGSRSGIENQGSPGIALPNAPGISVGKVSSAEDSVKQVIPQEPEKPTTDGKKLKANPKRKKKDN